MQHEKTVLINEDGDYDSTPTYLFDHADLYNSDPHEAGLVWMNEAHFGLGISYGLYSLLGKGTDSLVKTNIPLSSYENIKDTFSAEHFNAVDLVEFAIANGMRYIDFNVCGPDGFCLWNSASCDFNCAQSPAKRDLLGELASMCEYQGLGLCLTYSHGLSWRHPHAPGSRAGLPQDQVDLKHYLEFVEQQMHELLTQYGPIAAICLEGIDSARTVGHETMESKDLYSLIRMLQPQILLSYQQGLTGDEDFFTALQRLPGEEDSAELQGHINLQKKKMVQIRDSLTPGTWGYNPEFAGRHLSEQQIWDKLTQAGRTNVNLLLNTNLLPDGSLDLEDINHLLAVGKRIEHKGYPGMVRES